MSKTKILFFASNPKKTTKLSLDEEARSIAKKIRASDYRDTIDFVTAWAVRPADLLDELNLHKPTVVHFSGHGSGQDGLVLTDDRGKPKLVSTDALKMLFSTVKDNIRLVILNACFSAEQGQAISEVIECVVGMNRSISDNAAISFAASFYSALGYGRSAKEAFEQGKTALMLEGIPEENTPVILWRKGTDPGSLKITPESESIISNVLPLPGDIDESVLRKSMADDFNLEDLDVVCQDLQVELEKHGFKEKVNMEVVGGSGKVAKILNLIGYLSRRGLLGYLVLILRQHRPGIIVK